MKDEKLKQTAISLTKRAKNDQKVFIYMQERCVETGSSSHHGTQYKKKTKKLNKQKVMPTTLYQLTHAMLINVDVSMFSPSVSK